MPWSSTATKGTSMSPGSSTSPRRLTRCGNPCLRPLALSSLETRYMTHFIRRQMDAILIGAETAVMDNPSLNGKKPENHVKYSEDSGK